MRGLDDSLLKFPDHTHTHTHSVGLLRTSDRLVAESATYTPNNRPMGGNSMRLSWFKSAIPRMSPMQTYSLNVSANRIGLTK